MSKKIQNQKKNETSFNQLFKDYETSQKANGVKDVTLGNYTRHLRVFEKYLNIDRSIDDFSKKDFEIMIIAMKDKGMSHNTVATYVKTLRSFLHWCKKENLCDIKVPNMVEVETVKEVYSDDELALLLEEPPRSCDFTELRNWVIVNFLLNSGCRASTIRNIQIRDVDLQYRQIIYRHNKNGKIQSIPLCSRMVELLERYMKIRGGNPEDFLFCNQYGEMIQSRGLISAISRYNKRRGVNKTSIHAFRHTFARKYLLDCGGNAFTLDNILFPCGN